ncbi:hypothetical protein Nepgr_022495 [Nepenthes gracilis]|uniref:Uncharacterized protein n=1 Tax=Nepenthes gracilis TaxID=150966 RepID=A0AAD3XY55_NEPGR|nr:hypothetical protein Nepgr_022495 [Nepenthes gracilis]
MAGVDHSLLVAVVVDKSMAAALVRSKVVVVGSNKFLDSSTAEAVGRNMVVVVGRRTMGEVHMPFLSKPEVCVRMNLRSSEQGITWRIRGRGCPTRCNYSL